MKTATSSLRITLLPVQRQTMQELKLVLEFPTPLCIPHALAGLGPGAGLGGLSKGASKEGARKAEKAIPGGRKLPHPPKPVAYISPFLCSFQGPGKGLYQQGTNEDSALCPLSSRAAVPCTTSLAMTKSKVHLDTKLPEGRHLGSNDSLLWVQNKG